MEDHHRFRLIHTDQDQEDDDQEDEEFESEEEFEDEDEEDGEFEEDGADPFRERIILPVEFEEDGFDDGGEIGGVFEDGFEDDDEFEDDGFDEDEEEDGYEEDDEELVSLERMLNRVPIEYEEDDDDDDEEEDYEDEDGDGDVDGEDYEEEEDEVDEFVPVEMASSSRVSSSGFGGGSVEFNDEVEMTVFSGRSLQVNNEAEMASRRVLTTGYGGWSLEGGVVIDSGVVGSTENTNDLEACEGKDEDRESGGGEVHGLFCSICFEAWTSGGEHQICCLPCGHIYGLSCIKKWLQQSRPFGKCPQCNNICTFKDVRVLYASRLCVADEELHKRVRSLEAKCAYLEQKAGRLTSDEMIDQICSNPAALQRLATVIADLYHQPVSP